MSQRRRSVFASPLQRAILHVCNRDEPPNGAYGILQVRCAYTVSIGDEMIRRLFKTGNSIVLSLPKEVLDDLGIKDGESVNMELDRAQRRVIITPVEKPVAIAGVNDEFASQLDDFIRQYRTALEELAK